jgi:regulator of RNase E activity RraA
MILYREVGAIVVNGSVRDVHRLRKENYPIWCKGTTPLGCYNKDVPITKEIEDYIIQNKKIYHGAILVSDDSGCTLIKNNEIEDLFDKLNFIELQEDIWYFCIDTLKMSTFETICEKKYLDDPSLLPPILRDRLKKHFE